LDEYGSNIEVGRFEYCFKYGLLGWAYSLSGRDCALMSAVMLFVFLSFLVCLMILVGIF